MYGTIARVHPKPGHSEELKALIERQMRTDPPSGYRWSALFEPDDSPYPEPTMFLIALFDDEATYRANAASPDQDARYREFRELLEDDPDWMDGTFSGS